MAVTADTVQVDMEVDISTYLANLRRADAAFDSLVAGLEQDAARAGAAFSRIIPPGKSPLKPLVDEAPKASAAVKGVNGQLSNLGAQFQDIAVQLQSGTSPFTVAIQQGTQISAALGQAGGGAAGAVKALGAAFASIINPISIVTIAIIALGGAAIQYLSSILPRFETANEAIARHRKNLEEIVDGYDAAKAAVSDYTDAAGRLPRGIAIQQITKEFAEIRKESDAFLATVAQISSRIPAAASGAEKAVGAISDQFARGEISAEQFYLELQRIRTQDLGPLEFGIAIAIERLEEGALKAIAFGNAINQVVAASHALAGVAQDQTLANFFDENAVESVIDTLRGLTPELRTQQQIIEDTYSKALTNPALTEEAREQLRIAKESAAAAVNEAEARKVAEEAARSAASTAKQTTAEKERERQAVEALIEQLQFELETVGLSNEQKAIANALRRAGAAATDEERAQIEGLIIAREQENQKLKEAEALYNAIKSAAEQSLKSFLSDLAEGKSLGEAFKNVLDDILSRLIDFGVSTALNALFPGLGGGIAGARAMGGPVGQGQTYLVGERGPELFTPSSAGRITSNSDLASMAGGGGKVSIYLGPGLEASLLDQSARQSIDIVRATVPGMIGVGAPTATAQAQRNRVI